MPKVGRPATGKWPPIKMWRIAHAPPEVVHAVGLDGHERRSYKGWIAWVPRAYVEQGEPMALFASPWFCLGDPRLTETKLGFYVTGMDKGFGNVHSSAPEIPMPKSLKTLLKEPTHVDS